MLCLSNIGKNVSRGISLEGLLVEPGAEDGEGGGVVSALLSSQSAVRSSERVGRHHDRKLKFHFFLETFWIDYKLKNKQSN